MSLKLGRLPICNHPKCSNIGYAEDYRCFRHTTCSHINSVSLNDFKNPQTIEIEAYTDSEDTSDWLQENVGFKTDGDGSLDNSGIEVKVTNDGPRTGRVAAHVARSLVEQGDAYVDRDCGMHVHMCIKDELHKYNRFVLRDKMWDNFKKLEDEIITLFPDRCRERGYSSRLESINHWRRYNWINVGHRWETSEFRVHPGSLNSNIIIAWSRLCHSFRRVIKDVINEKPTKKAKKFVKGEFINLFDKGTVARNYLDFRLANRGNDTTIEREYALPE